MRQRIFEIIEVDSKNDRLSKAYDIIMLVTIFVSIIPLTTPKDYPFFTVIDKITLIIFLIDYFLRIITADLKIKKGKASFVLYPFTPMAIIDLVSILPSLIIINKSLKLLRVVRLIRTFRVFRVFKSFRYSKNISIIVNVFKRQKDSLMVVCALAIGYVLITALIMLNVEPETFGNFFNALYWATISLTTVGYGDLYAESTIGQVITMISSLLGIAIVALPAGIITAGYMEEVQKNKR